MMNRHPFYAVLLFHLRFALDPGCDTAYTDGKSIVFCPDFLKKLSDSELMFVLMHEVLHVALNHCGREEDFYDFDDFNTACDIVVNSNILYSFDMDLSAITLTDYGESMHLAPDGKEGYLYTAEEVYALIRARKNTEEKIEKNQPSSGGETDGRQKTEENGESKDGSRKKDETGDAGTKREKDEPDGEKPEDGTEESAPARTDGGFDDHTYWEPEKDGDGDGEGTGKGKGEGEGTEKGESGDGDGDGDGNGLNPWTQYLLEAAQIAEQIRIHSPGKGYGSVPFGAQRFVMELTRSQLDWKTVLDTFIEEEINDYSFNPPDRRFQDSPFLLPDYNEKDQSVKDILFMIDTSASMSDKMVTQVYSEIYWAITQFNGKLRGWLGFFNDVVIEPKEFESEDTFRVIRPIGPGATSFHCIFYYVKEHLDKIRPEGIVILTDGGASWPDESDALGIPVLWIINNEEFTPPWGKLARIKAEKEEESDEQNRIYQ